jgi:hypothetical protein
MGGKHLKFQKNPKYPHHRSEGTHARRGARRTARLLKVCQRCGKPAGHYVHDGAIYGLDAHDFEV